MPRAENNKLDKVIAEARRSQELRETTYREKALNMFPRICARCGREFSGKRLRELTVHHKDHNHENNPPDGSNWELLCIYCHDMEHQRYLDEGVPDDDQDSVSKYKPFACLESLLKDKK
ncbi:MAG: YajD family HNH nuclease [Deltaproteobacteria bacterium]|nr:YajD family HNH nuclease [Deltaproteobacteria bacterium]